MNGSFACERRVNIAVVLAICISENRPSCMRAPPEAVTQMKRQAVLDRRLHPAHEALAKH
jgi:hypothetical protein